jgi:hypothetical protein
VIVTGFDTRHGLVYSNHRRFARAARSVKSWRRPGSRMRRRIEPAMTRAMRAETFLAVCDASVQVGVQAPAKQNPNEQFVKSALGLHLPRLHRFWPFCFFRHFPGSHRAHSPHGFLHLPDLAARLPDGESPMRARIAVARALLPMRAMPRRDVVKGRRRAMASNAWLFMGNLLGHPRHRRGGVAMSQRR